MSIFINGFLKEMNKIKQQGDQTIAQLNEAQLHWTPSHGTNSVAILIQHISGNMISRSTDFLTTDGEKPSRNRDSEFINQSYTKVELIEIWESAWTSFFNTVSSLTEEDLFQEVTVKAKQFTATAALLTMLVHYSGHISQMMMIGKLQLNDQWVPISIQPLNNN